MLRQILVIILTFAVLSAAPATLSTSGEADTEVAPDVLYVSMGVQRDGYTALDAQEALQRDLQKVIAELKTIGFEAETLKTDSYSIYPIYRQKKIDDNTTEEEISKYRAYIRLTCETAKASDAGKILDTAVKAGANRIEQVLFTLKDPQIAKDAALKKAIQRATEKAGIMAEGFNVRLVGPAQISEASYGFESPTMFKAMSVADSNSLPEGKVKVRSRVDVTFEIVTLNPRVTTGNL